MHSDLYVFKKKDETIDEEALLKEFDKVSRMGVDSLELMRLRVKDEKELKDYRDSVTELKPAVAYLDEVKKAILGLTSMFFNPDAALGSDEYDYSLTSLFDLLDDCKGDWLAISEGDGQFAFLRRFDFAADTASHNGEYAGLVKNMDLVLYDYHY